mmetsp:Transcript_76780/g.212133  ORF Transcript_76780/g.212133 Transcript_76780/m.212133 type:complete len:197 (+) Transcript_76780:76-666(+)
MVMMYLGADEGSPDSGVMDEAEPLVFEGQDTSTSQPASFGRAAKTATVLASLGALLLLAATAGTAASARGVVAPTEPPAPTGPAMRAPLDAAIQFSVDFDCLHDRHWRKGGWTVAKKDYCCKKIGKGCEWPANLAWILIGSAIGIVMLAGCIFLAWVGHRNMKEVEFYHQQKFSSYRQSEPQRSCMPCTTRCCQKA